VLSLRMAPFSPPLRPHVARRELRNAQDVLESVRAIYHRDAEPVTRVYERAERIAAGRLVALRELELEQAILSERLEEARRLHSRAFQAYLTEKKEFETQ